MQRMTMTFLRDDGPPFTVGVDFASGDGLREAERVRTLSAALQAGYCGGGTLAHVTGPTEVPDDRRIQCALFVLAFLVGAAVLLGLAWYGVKEVL